MKFELEGCFDDQAEDSARCMLCLAGGNALGAYHAGVYLSLQEAGVEPSRIAGASIGGIIGAIIAGNRPEDRAAQLERFWRLATETHLMPGWLQPVRFKVASAIGTLMYGRPGLFNPSLIQWWKRICGLSPSLFDRSSLRKALPQFIDFEHLNNGEIRLLVNAVDLETAAEVVFDTARSCLTIDHLMATTAFPVFYAPEKIDGKTFVDGGISSNLPLRALIAPRHLKT